MKKLLLILVFTALLPLGYLGKEVAFGAGETTGTNTATAIATACKGNNCNTVTATHTVTFTIPTTHDTVTVTTGGTPPPPPPPPPPAGTPLCFGDPTGPVAGWPTSNGYSRQYPFGHPERVSFDDSVNVMQSVGCRTVRAELQAGDLDTNGGTVNLRAQLYKDPNQATYDEQETNPGQTTWYGMAFTTNPGYVPQADPNFPNWNVVFTWHSTIEGGGNPISMVIATKAISTVDCGGSYVPFSDGQPHLMLEVNGGDPAQWPTGGATCKRIPGPVFIPGHLYRVEHKVTWSDNFAGAVEWWVDGVQYTNLTGVSNMTLGGRVWALWENYRPYATSFPTADIYYGGLVKGASRSDVMVP